MPSRRVLALVLAGLLARLLIIWSGWAEGPLIADDAYYYFKIAANLAAHYLSSGRTAEAETGTTRSR